MSTQRVMILAVILISVAQTLSSLSVISIKDRITKHNRIIKQMQYYVACMTADGLPVPQSYTETSSAQLFVVQGELGDGIRVYQCIKGKKK